MPVTWRKVVDWGGASDECAMGAGGGQTSSHKPQATKALTPSAKPLPLSLLQFEDGAPSRESAVMEHWSESSIRGRSRRFSETPAGHYVCGDGCALFRKSAVVGGAGFEPA